jgi:DNA-binding phage protein
MNYIEFKGLGLEVVLKVLKKIDDEIKIYRNLEDYEGVKTLETEVLPKYEKLYNAFSSKLDKDTVSENLENIEKYIFDIMVENNLSKDFIITEINKRKKLKGNSGAEAVENLYKYELNQLTKKKSSLLHEANIILDEESKLEKELSDSIQEEDQMLILDKLPEVRRKYNELSEKIMKIHEKIEMIIGKLEKKWYFDIYGTVSKDDLLKVYKEVIK